MNLGQQFLLLAAAASLGGVAGLTLPQLDVPAATLSAQADGTTANMSTADEEWLAGKLDAALSDQVQSSLTSSAEIDAPGVTIRSVNGIVTLSGNVRSDAERERVVRTAATAAGLSSVKDRLDVAETIGGDY